MFELKQQIDAWKNELLADKSMGREDVEELLSHLESSIDELQLSGLSAEEALFVAKHRLGDLKALNSEYSKVNAALIWRKRFMWLVSGYFLFSSIPLVVNFIVATVFVLDVKSLIFSGSVLFGDEFQVPYPIYIVALLILSGGLFYLMSEGSRFNKKPTRQNFGYKTIAWIFSGYIFLSTLSVGSMILLPRFSSMNTYGNIAASGGLFNFSWQLFLCASLLLTVIISRRKENSPLTA